VDPTSNNFNTGTAQNMSNNQQWGNQGQQGQWGQNQGQSNQGNNWGAEFMNQMQQHMNQNTNQNQGNPFNQWQGGYQHH